MEFIKDDANTIVHHLDLLDEHAKPLWGKMTAQRMVEHLTDGVLAGIGQKIMTCPYEGEKLQRSREFLLSDKPMPLEFKAHFVDDDAPLRNPSFDEALDELINAWIDMEEYSELRPEAVHIHPVFGPLDQREWRWMHRKHFTHHLTQFGVTISDISDDYDDEDYEDED
jgi:hypothetical protein